MASVSHTDVIMAKMAKAVSIGTAIMLVIALAQLPYGYYTLLRFVVCGACLIIAWAHVKECGFDVWVGAFCAAAVLFNPFIPIHLSRSLWTLIDLGLAALLLTHMQVTKLT